jgi:hypothetical protein
MTTRLEHISTDRLENELADLEATIGRLRAQQVERLREIDGRQVPLGDGCRSLNEWVVARLDVSPETASDLVRIIRAGNDLLTEAIGSGRVTFDRAAALARLETATDPARFTHLDLPGLKRYVARHRRMTPVDERSAAEGRYFTIQPNLDESGWKLWGSLPGYDGRIVEQALMTRADSFPNDPTPLGAGQRRADALVSVCQDSIDGIESVGSSEPLVSVFVDADLAAPTRGQSGVSIAAGPRVGTGTLERILCTGSVEVITAETAQRVGGQTRIIPPRLRRWVLHRDGGCVVDGCTSRYRLQPHHITPWSEGGRTETGNLATLCWFHHHVVVHVMGYRFDADSPPLRRRFVAPAGADPP